MNGKVVAEKFKKQNSKIKVPYTSQFTSEDIAHTGEC